jgi:hypothetical protein
MQVVRVDDRAEVYADCRQQKDRWQSHSPGQLLGRDR